MRRFLLLSGLAYGLFWLGLATLSGAPIALALPLVVCLGAALLYGPGEVRLAVARSLSADRVSGGASVTVTLSLTNRGPALEEVLIEDRPSPSLEIVEGETRVLASLRPGETIQLTYVVRGRRGIFSFDEVHVTARDRLGLFWQRATLWAPDRLLVLPEVARMRRVAIRPLRTHGFAGPVPARRGGSGVEFFGLREYQMGDPLRWINWRASARHFRALFTNEFEQERIADVGLILDARRRSDVHVEGESLFEHAARAAASLADLFLSDGNRVGLLVYGGVLSWTFPGYGKVQRESILRNLAEAKTGESRVFDTLDYLPTRFFPARSQLVVISPLWRDDLSALVRLRARGYQVLIVSPDPIAFEAAALRPEPAARLAERISRLERRLLLRKLSQAGIQIVDWPVALPLDRAVQTSLGRTPHWYRALGLALRS